MNLSVYKPLLTIQFWTETGELVARSIKVGDNDTFDGDIINLSTERRLGDDSPTFSISLTNRVPWHKYVASNDLVIISMCRPPEKSRIVLMGTVDDVRKKVVMSDSEVSRQITISGRGLSKSLMFDIGVVPETQIQDATLGWLIYNNITFAGNTVSGICNAVWEQIVKKYVKYSWTNGKSFSEMVNLRASSREDCVMTDEQNFANYQGSILYFFREMAEDPFYELFFEINDNNEPDLIIRPTPFNQNDWQSLPYVEITDEDVVISDVGRSDVETYTLYSVGACILQELSDTGKTAGIPPLCYEPFYHKYGIKRLHVDSKFVNLTESAVDPKTVTALNNLTQDLFNWNIKNNQMFNGNLVVKGQANYRIGTRLIYTSNEDNSKIEYYITGVSHEFNPSYSWTTRLELTRGIEPSQRFTAPFGCGTGFDKIGLAFSEYQPDVVSTINNLYGEQSGGVPGIDTDSSLGVVQGAYNVMTNGINGKKVRYVYGGNSIENATFDCSSFTQYIYSKYANVAIGRTTKVQVTKGVAVSKSQAQPGDLILFHNTVNRSQPSHVGIVVGGGKMIHNGSSSTNVVEVSYETSYWNERFLTIRRVLPSTSQGTTASSPTSLSYTNFTATAYGAHKVNLGYPKDRWDDPTLPAFPWGLKTAMGTEVRPGVVAVDKSVIPLGSKLHIISDYPGITGYYSAEDTGNAIKGNIIDIYMDDRPPVDPKEAHNKMLAFGRRSIKVAIVERG